MYAVATDRWRQDLNSKGKKLNDLLLSELVRETSEELLRSPRATDCASFPPPSPALPSVTEKNQLPSKSERLPPRVPRD